MVSVLKHTKTPVKFWILKNFLSPDLKVSVRFVVHVRFIRIYDNLKIKKLLVYCIRSVILFIKKKIKMCFGNQAGPELKKTKTNVGSITLSVCWISDRRQASGSRPLVLKGLFAVTVMCFPNLTALVQGRIRIGIIITNRIKTHILLLTLPSLPLSTRKESYF